MSDKDRAYKKWEPRPTRPDAPRLASPWLPLNVIKNQSDTIRKVAVGTNYQAAVAFVVINATSLSTPII